jgi:hypothetical protein
MRYRFVAAERATFPVRTLCRIVGVAVSGFYAWLRRGPGRRRRDDRRVSERIAAIFEASRRTCTARGWGDTGLEPTRPGPRLKAAPLGSRRAA